MIPSYLVALVPTLALACGVMLAIETVARYTESQGEAMIINMFGIPFDATSADDMADRGRSDRRRLSRRAHDLAAYRGGLGPRRHRGP